MSRKIRSARIVAQREVTISKTFDFDAAHFLPNVARNHKCRRMHGHTYRVEIICWGVVDARGMVLDYAEIAAAWQLLMNCPKPSVGTSMEVFFGHSLGKRVLIIAPSGPVSPWLRAHGEIFTTLRDALRELTA